MSSFNNPNHGSDLPGGNSGGQSGLDATRQQVDEVVDIMRNNVEKGTSEVIFQTEVIYPNFKFSSAIQS